MKTNVTYPDGCNESTKQFVDKINEILDEMKGIVLDEFYLGQNGVYSTIYKIVLPIISLQPLNVLTMSEHTCST